MIYELENDEQIRPLFAELARIHLHVLSILQGDCRGEVYVDDPDHPQTACIDAGEVFYLAGDPNQPLFNAALNAHLPRDTYFVLFCDPERWAGALNTILANTYAVRARRHYYQLQQLKTPNWQEQIPEGFSMQALSPAPLAQGLKNSDEIAAGIQCKWPSLEAFFEQGFGFCLTHQGDIASWSLVDYASGPRCEIGVNTDWDYRRRGLGTMTAAANAAYAVAQGFASVGWHCWANNVGSIGVAHKVGFEKSAEYDVFINHWAAENVSDMTPDEFEAFAQFYESEFEANPPSSGFPHVVAAKAWALARDRAGCFRQLNQAVDLGWLRGVEHLRQIWPEFFFNPNLDQMPEWQDMVERFEATT